MGFVHCAGSGNWALGTGFGTDGMGLVSCAAMGALVARR